VLSSTIARTSANPRADAEIAGESWGRDLARRRGALPTTPESARANLESGRVLLQLGQLEAAAKRLEKAAQRSPSDWNAHLLLGRAYQRLGRDAEAERELQSGEAGWRRKQP